MDDEPDWDLDQLIADSENAAAYDDNVETEARVPTELPAEPPKRPVPTVDPVSVAAPTPPSFVIQTAPVPPPRPTAFAAKLSRRVSGLAPSSLRAQNAEPAFVPGACLLSRPPATGRSFSIVLPDKSLFFVAVGEPEASDDADGMPAVMQPEGLLDVPVEELLAKLDADAAAVGSSGRRAGGDASGVFQASSTRSRGTALLPPGATPSAALWVDRYAPHGFLDLLSSDALNRSVVRWIKLWDGRVFSSAKQRAAAAAAAVAAASQPRPQKRARIGGLDMDGGAGSDGNGDSDDDGRGARRRSSNAAYRGGGRGGRHAGSGAGAAASAVEEPAHIRELRARFGFGWKLDAKVLLFAGPPGAWRGALALVPSLSPSPLTPRHGISRPPGSSPRTLLPLPPQAWARRPSRT